MGWFTNYELLDKIENLKQELFDLKVQHKTELADAVKTATSRLVENLKSWENSFHEMNDTYQFKIDVLQGLLKQLQIVVKLPNKK